MRRSGGRALALALLLAGCGGGGAEDANRARGETLTIYSSGPRHGVSAAAGEAVFAGQRLALQEAGGRAGGRRIRLVRLAATRPGDTLWDPGIVRANADRARKDPSAIAYLGELDYGGSAISLPVTNRAELLQVSPTDGLTSLTKVPPGRPRAGPERLYPEDVRTFARMVPNDLVVADGVMALLPGKGTGATAILHGQNIADRELTAILVHRLRQVGAEPAFVEVLRDDVEAVPGLIRRLAASHPAAIVVVGRHGPATAAALGAIARQEPGVAVVGTAGLIPHGRRPGSPDLRAVTPVLPGGAQPAGGRRLLRDLERRTGAPVRADALYGYAAMRLVLAAIDRSGADRRGVVRAARAPGTRRTALGSLSLDRDGDVRTRRLAVARLRRGQVTLELMAP